MAVLNQRDESGTDTMSRKRDKPYYTNEYTKKKRKKSESERESEKLFIKTRDP